MALLALRAPKPWKLSSRFVAVTVPMAQQAVTEEQKLVGAVPGRAEVVSEKRQQAVQILLVLERAVLERAVLERD